VTFQTSLGIVPGADVVPELCGKFTPLSTASQPVEAKGRWGAPLQAAFVRPSRLTSLAGKERSHRPLPWNTSSLINVSFSLTSFPSLRRMVGKARNRRCRIGAFLAAFPAALLMLILPRSTNRRRGAQFQKHRRTAAPDIALMRAGSDASTPPRDRRGAGLLTESAPQGSQISEPECESDGAAHLLSVATAASFALLQAASGSRSVQYSGIGTSHD
jgi:hypothetical protein